MKNQIRNIFVSHIHEDDSGIANLKNLAKAHNMELRDSSIRSSNPNNATNHDYIKSEILGPAIRHASTLVVYISPGTKNSDWVDWEIRYAHKCGKRIVGVYEHGAADCDIPDALDEYGDALVGWNGRRIVAAIRGEIDDWKKSNGEPPRPRQIKRYSCSTVRK